MIPLKEHNNIVEALMKEINNRESQIKQIQKEKLKTPSQIPQLQPNTNEQLLNKKITQLNKEFKQRVNNLSQQLRSKSQENKDLKERLVTKANIQTKQREHIAEILKKTYDRKPSSGADYKISALVSHYDAEIAKKNKFIQALQKQIKLHQMNDTNSDTPLEDNENYKSGSENEDKPKAVTLVQHQQEIAKIKAEVQKYRKLHQQKEKQYKDLARRYTQLTNQYYKILNSYGIEQPKKSTTKISYKTKSESAIGIAKRTLGQKSNTNALHNLLQQMVGTDSEMDQSCLDKPTLKSSVRSLQSQASQKSIQNDRLNQQQCNADRKQEWAASKLQQVLQFFNLTDVNDLLPYLCKTKTKLQEYQLADTVTRTLQTFFYNVGKGRIARQQLVDAIQNLQLTYTRNLEAVDTLDEICIQVGAKRQKLVQKLNELLQIKQQYYGQLKSLKFTQELAKGNKLIQFIDFFSLDKEQVALPQQLINLQEQLKYINKFVKQAKIILDIDPQKSFEMVLQLVLRYLQKTSCLVNKLQKKIQKPKPTPN